VAFFVGAALDKRAAQESIRDGYKASLSGAQMQGSSVQGADVQGEIELLSGVSGKPLLSLDRWLPKESLRLHGVEVANMMSRPHYLRRSLNRGYVFRGAVVDAVWQRSDSFVDLALGETSNGATLLRLSPQSVEAFFASRKNRLVSIEKTALAPSDTPCQRFEVSASERQLSVSCDGGAPVLTLHPAPTAFDGRVSIASTLAHGEVRDLVVTGRIRDAEFQDQR
jgi:hypothetical protein